MFPSKFSVSGYVTAFSHIIFLQILLAKAQKQFCGACEIALVNDRAF